MIAVQVNIKYLENPLTLSLFSIFQQQEGQQHKHFKMCALV